MSETIATLQKQIAGYVLMPTDSEVTEAALIGMRRAVDHLNLHNWNDPFAIAREEITFVEGQYDYPLESWFKAPLNFECRDVNGLTQQRLEHKPLKIFLLENTKMGALGTPTVYSFSDVATVSLDNSPGTHWIERFPTAVLSYHRYFTLPTAGVGAGQPLDVFPSATAYVQAFAEGYVADRFAPEKASMAYRRAFTLYNHETHTGALLTSDNNVMTDWQGE